MVADREKPEVKALEHQILEAESEIEQATLKLFHLESVLKEFCDDVCQKNPSSLLNFDIPFDFANISLVVPTQNTIESMYGTGIAKRWANRARHYLAEDQNLRDIQANIIKTHQTEIIAGWDERFDRWIYDTFHHERLIRIFTPIFIIRDKKNGKVIEDWFEHYPWEENFIIKAQTTEGPHIVIEMVLPPDLALPEAIEVIGTVEAGYEDRQTRTITLKQAAALAKLTARHALAIHQARLSYVLEIIAEKAKDILQADLTTLHFLYEPPPQESYIHYIYEVCAGNVSHLVIRQFPPRRDGLGWQAICEGKPKCIPDFSQGHDEQEVARFNPKASDEQSKAYAAFPLHVDGKQWATHAATTDSAPENEKCQEWLESSSTSVSVGVLYVHFQREHCFTEEEMRWGQLFANRAADAIRHVMAYRQVHDRALQLADLHEIAQSFTRLEKKDDLLRHIAWATLNTLAADVITIHEYIETERKFLKPSEVLPVAGWLREKQRVYTEVDEDDVPFQIVKRGESIYAVRAKEEQIFIRSEFAERESVKSVAGVLLRVGLEIVGVMFVNYRRLHDFSNEEKQIIETLSSHAAIAIKNQRWLEIISDIDREIIGTLDQEKLLSQILERAVQITAAELGVIRLLDPINRELVMQAKYPVNALVDPTLTRIKVGEGITGWVAMKRKPALIDEVWNDQRYKPFLASTQLEPRVHSELCVPLLDKDRRLLGVINMESYRPKAFDAGHQRMLEALADLAVIAIQNVENKEQAVTNGKLATLNALASPLVHQMNNGVGAIQGWAQEILARGDEYSKDMATQILSSVDLLCQGARQMTKKWMEEEQQCINLQQAILDVVEQMHISSKVCRNICLPPNLPEVLGGRHLLAEVFYNLVQNALDAMPEGGTLSIDGNVAEQNLRDWVVVRICDNGIGIPEKDLEEIFKPGYTTKDSKGGMGIGLWWTKLYIKSLGGLLTVKSAPSQGSQFTVMLPAYKQKS